MKETDIPLRSEKLETLAKQIKDLLLAADVAGVVVLHEPERMKHVLHLETTYSVAHMEGTKFRIAVPPEDSADPKVGVAKVASTVNMLANLRAQVQGLHRALLTAELATRQKFNIKPPNQPPKIIT